MAAAWGYEYPFIGQFRTDKSYKLFGWQDGMAIIFESRKHRLNNLIQAFTLASVLVAVLPVPPKYHIKRHGKTTGVKKQKIQNREVSRTVFQHIFRSLNVHFNTGKLMLCADGQMRQWYAIISAWTADHLENIHLHSNQPPHCTVCEAPKSLFGDETSFTW